MKTTFENRTGMSVLGTGKRAGSPEIRDAVIRKRTGVGRERARRVAVSIRGGRIVFVPILSSGKDEDQ